MRLAISDALRAHRFLRLAIFNTISLRPFNLLPQIVSVADAISCALFDHSGRKIIVVLVRRIVRPVEDRRAPIVAGERNPVLDAGNQVLSLKSQNMITWPLKNP